MIFSQKFILNLSGMSSDSHIHNNVFSSSFKTLRTSAPPGNVPGPLGNPPCHSRGVELAVVSSVHFRAEVL